MRVPQKQTGRVLSGRVRFVETEAEASAGSRATSRSPPAATPTAPTPTPPALRACGSCRGRHSDGRDPGDAESVGADIAHERSHDESQNGHAACQQTQDLCHRRTFPCMQRCDPTYPLAGVGQVNNTLRRKDFQSCAAKTRFLPHSRPEHECALRKLTAI